MEQREKNDIKRNDVLQLLIQLKNKGYVDDVDGGKEINESKINFKKSFSKPGFCILFLN